MSKQPSLSFWFTSRGIVAAMGIGFLLYFLVIEHGAHLFPYLPYLILLLCPFMHFFMHGSHGHDDKHDEHDEHDENKNAGDEQYRLGYEEGLKDKKPERGDGHA